MSQALHPDQLICCQCKHREISKHNIACPFCPGVTMAFESAILQLDAARPQVEMSPKPPGQEEVPGQMSLFGGIVA